MAQDLHLRDDQEELMLFILDTTIERWKDEEPAQMDLMAADPSFATIEALTEATGFLSQLTQRAVELRGLVTGEEVT